MMFEAWDDAAVELEQDAEQDPGSFEDSDRFEEDSICSWLSEAESLCTNWRGWKKCSSGSAQGSSPQPQKFSALSSTAETEMPSLLELSARKVAGHFPFELVDRRMHPVPEHVQKRIAFWSFPETDEDIRLYACLANGNAEEFQKGEHLFKAKLVKDLIQIGFHLSASVVPLNAATPIGNNSVFNVAVTFDRHRITSCSCTCRHAATTTWCAHVVAVCLQRIHQPLTATLRASLSESFEHLTLYQLRKFAQYFITELPRQVLPTAQRLLDELLNASSIINTTHGAPDPTAESSAGEQSCWCLDEDVLHENIRNLLVKFCIPTPLVCSDVNFLSTCAPPAAAEWTSLLRPLRGKEPEGMWNLLSIIREMFRRSDNNAVPLLRIITEECLACEQIVMWWYSAKASHGHAGGVSCGFGRMGNGPSVAGPQNASAGLMDEIATLWRLAALNPRNSDEERIELKEKLMEYHHKCIEKVRKARDPNGQNVAGSSLALTDLDLDFYSGFKPAIDVCFLDWSSYPVEHPSYDIVSPSQTNLHCVGRTRDFLSIPVQGNHLGRIRAQSVPQRVVKMNVLLFKKESAKKPTKPDSGNDSQDEESKPSTSAPHDAVNAEKVRNEMEVSFMRAEALYAHGYAKEACALAVTLAEGLLTNPPSFVEDCFVDENVSLKQRKRANHQTTLMASTTIARVTFLVNVLSESSVHHNLAFRLGFLGIEMARPPAITKSLEVKMAHQEMELVTLIKKIPLGTEEYAFIRQRAEALRDGEIQAKGDALLPLNLALFIFEALSGTVAGPLRKSPKESGDEELCFQAAVAALGLKANVCEADHPLVCEGIRRQRGELACALLLYYKDDTVRLEKIMDRLLDKEIHKMQRNVPKHVPSCIKTSDLAPCAPSEFLAKKSASSSRVPLSHTLSMQDMEAGVQNCSAELAFTPRTVDSEDSSTFEEDNRRLRCTIFKQKRRPHDGISGIDSSAPETTSSDNSPTMIRRYPRLKQVGPGSDTGSSGDSSTDSRGSSFKQDDELLAANAEVAKAAEALARSSTPCAKGNKIRPKRSPTEPNQPSEALAHFMFELAKTVLAKAGGNVSTASFQPAWGQNRTGAHRALHMCAFQIGLYALGIHNCVSQNWQSRTYSSHVSWITGQAMELGVSAIHFLLGTWETHLTPPEAALLADKASRSSDLQMVRAAAELAQTALPHSHALNPNEIQRALAQCKEQSAIMLEQALLAVENAAKGGGVCPEALFDVAHKWYDMYAEHVGEVQISNGEHDHAVFSNNQADHHPNLLPVPIPLHLSQYPYVANRHHNPYFVGAPGHGRMHHALAPGLMNPFFHHLNAGMMMTGGLPQLPVVPSQHMVQIPHPPLQHPQLHGMPAAIPKDLTPYILSAYRVGMLAMETLARRIHDGQTNKYSKTPPHGEFVKWLYDKVAKKLGYAYVQQFCLTAVNTLSSPYMLWEIAVDAAQYLANSNNPHALGLQLRSRSLDPLVQKSLQMFNSCLRQKLHHISAPDYDDFIATASAAQRVYLSVTNGVPFLHFLSEVRKSKSCKRDLLARLEAAFGPIPP